MVREDGATLERRYRLNMPHMALGGLSEAWLFRELGDIHWTLLSAGLRAPSSELTDANGDRLYAAFTRLKVTSSAPLMAFPENDPIAALGKIARFGKGVFFGNITLGNESRRIEAQLMTSFTKRSSANSNLSLLKGQPVIPSDSPIPALAEMPEFAQEYRQLRSVAPETVLFESEYRIQPYHDINGVGLLYFAAYPTINDLCEMRYSGDYAAWCMDTSTVARDVCYFGNCDVNDHIIYRLHNRKEGDGYVTLTSSLTRGSDGVTIARLVTTKALGLNVGA